MEKYKNTFKPYLINAFYTWSLDSGFTPLIEVSQASSNLIPESLKKNENILFNIHSSAITHLIFGKDTLEFEAKIEGLAHKISIPHNNIKKIFSKEVGYGLEFNNLQFEMPVIETKHMKRKGHLVLIKNEDN